MTDDEAKSATLEQANQELERKIKWFNEHCVAVLKDGIAVANLKDEAVRAHEAEARLAQLAEERNHSVRRHAELETQVAQLEQERDKLQKENMRLRLVIDDEYLKQKLAALTRADTPATEGKPDTATDRQ